MKKAILIIAAFALFTIVLTSCSTSSRSTCPAYIDKVDHPTPNKPA